MGAAVAATTPSARTIGPAAAMPLVGDRLLDERRHRQRLLRIGGGIVALVLIGAALAVALSMALGDDDPGISTVTTTAQPAAVVTTVAPATTVAPTTVPPTTVAPTTVPPTTVAPTTVPPTTVPPTTVSQELIPGFPVPVDFEDFLRLLDDDPDAVGERGEDLFKELEKLFEDPPGRRSDRREELRDDIVRWSDDDELDPIIAAAAIHYIDELEARD